MADIKQPINAQPQVRVCSLSSLIDRRVILGVFSQGTPQMSVGGNRNAKNCPVGPDGRREWSFGLFDCFSRFGLCT